MFVNGFLIELWRDGDNDSMQSILKYGMWESQNSNVSHEWMPQNYPLNFPRRYGQVLRLDEVFESVHEEHKTLIVNYADVPSSQPVSLS